MPNSLFELSHKKESFKLPMLELELQIVAWRDYKRIPGNNQYMGMYINCINIMIIHVV